MKVYWFEIRNALHEPIGEGVSRYKDPNRAAKDMGVSFADRRFESEFDVRCIRATTARKGRSIQRAFGK
ncbi:MAG: hypothetical protein WC471_03760 [Candidatus Woesearchaeota archaeon]